MKIPSKYSEKEILLGLFMIDGVGQSSLRKIVHQLPSLDFRFCNQDQRNSISNFDWALLDELLINLKKNNIGLVSFLEDSFPESLKEIPDFPPFLFYKGDFGILSQPCFSIVGTRKMSTYGKRCVEKFVPPLVEKDWVIVSGMAFGIDHHAQKTTLSSGGKTVAVLASGVDIPSPASNTRLYNEILENGGLIVSELLPGTQPVPGFFPRRNRIISGLSMGVLVVEAGEKSGSLITAYSAFEQNREVFAVPGNLGNLGSLGTNKIIKNDVAKLVTEPEDILIEFGYVENKMKGNNKIDLIFGSSQEEEVYNLLIKKGALATDDLAAELNISISAISNILTMMELKGMLTAVESKYMVTL